LQSEGPGLNFDVVTAIRVCRQAGYFKQALVLARKHHVHDLYLKIQLDDHGDYQEALDYITKLPFAAVSCDFFFSSVQFSRLFA
jgi:hypothetical protein